jgi:hypothetical protein
MTGKTHDSTATVPGAWWRVLAAALMAVFLLASLIAPVAASQGAGPDAAQRADEEAEIAYQPDYLYLATGDPSGEHSVYAWPFALESIGHVMQSYQYYGGSPYFHHGMDIMAPSGTQIYNRSGGQIVNIENYTPGNDLYWEVAVLDPEGYLWQYHHVDHYTIPLYIWNKYNDYLLDPVNGGFVPADTWIGNIVWWPVGYPGAPTNFHHIHLNILGADGHYLQGMAFHTPLADDDSPEIQAIGLLKNGQVYPGNQVSGDYGLYVHARDLVLAPEAYGYWLPPYEVKFSVDRGPATTVWRFDDIPGGGDRYAYVSDFYVVPPTCGDYDCNEFYIDLGFTKEGQRAFPPTAGQHLILVKVRDFAGNTATGTFTWTVTATASAHIGDLDGNTVLNPNGTWRAKVIVAVHNQYHQALAGATVMGDWSGGGSGSCVTATNGRCAVVKNIGGTVPSVSFAITSVTKSGYPYLPANNHDPDGDSNGTVITILKP